MGKRKTRLYVVAPSQPPPAATLAERDFALSYVPELTAAVFGDPVPSRSARLRPPDPPPPRDARLDNGYPLAQLRAARREWLRRQQGQVS